MTNGLVAISTNITFVPERNEYRDTLDHRLVNWVQSLGLVPYLVPNGIQHIEDLMASVAHALLDHKHLTSVVHGLSVAWFEQTSVLHFVLSSHIHLASASQRESEA